MKKDKIHVLFFEIIYEEDIPVKARDKSKLGNQYEIHNKTEQNSYKYN